MRGFEIDFWQSAIALRHRHAGRVDLLPHAGHGHHPRAPEFKKRSRSRRRESSVHTDTHVDRLVQSGSRRT